MRSIFLSLSGLGLVFGIIVNTKTADLYKGNAHKSIGWVAMGMVVVHALTDAILRFTKRSRTIYPEATESTGTSCCPSIDTVHQIIHSRRPGINGQVSGISRLNSGHGLPNISQHHPSRERESSESESDDDDEGEDEYKSLVPSRWGFLRNRFIHKYSSRRIPDMALSKLPRMFEFLHKAIDWTILVVGYVTLVTGGVTYTGIFVSERQQHPTYDESED